MPAQPSSAIIKSSDREVRSLIEALGEKGTRGEAAIARLTIIGARAVSRLISAFHATSDRRVQRAILRVLEATGDDRVLPLARCALAGGGDLALQGVAVLQELLGRGPLPVQAEALDFLVAVASDSAAERRVRLAAAQAVDCIAATIGQRGGRQQAALSPGGATWDDAAEGHLPDDPDTLRAAAREQAERAPLPVVHRIIEAIRAREHALGGVEDAGASATFRQWRAVRGALHQALARRGSRIALYDLRETVAAASEPLPSSFLAAVQLGGDASCLEPLAVALTRTPAGEARWRHQLVTAFRTVVKRERLTKKNPALRRALARCPDL